MDEKIFDYVDHDDLQRFLKGLPHPNWDEPYSQYHYQTSASKYDKCTQLIQRPFGNIFKMVRGSKYHDYYIPKIMEFMGLEGGEYECLHKVLVPCKICGKKFSFGGSIDYYNKPKKWLIDFKFSESKYSTDSYIPQVSAYAYFSKYGLKRVNKEWLIADGPVETITIFKINPVTFECSENTLVAPLTKDEIMTKAIKYHEAVKHKKINHSPGINCRWCEDKKCIHRIK